MNDVPMMNRLLRDAEKVTTQQASPAVEFKDDGYRNHAAGVDATMKSYRDFMCGLSPAPV